MRSSPSTPGNGSSSQPDHPLFTRQERFIRLTSNNFLVAIGEPTRVEAGIGQIYTKRLVLKPPLPTSSRPSSPSFKKHLANATKGRRGTEEVASRRRGRTYVTAYWRIG
jgi:hypothetical protein